MTRLLWPCAYCVMVVFCVPIATEAESSGGGALGNLDGRGSRREQRPSGEAQR